MSLSPVASPHYRPRLAITLRLVSAMQGALFAALVKLATNEGANAPEIMFYRFALSMPFIAIWALSSGGVAAIKTKRPLGHFVRALIGMANLLIAFLTVSHLPLPEATTFFFMAPLIATVLSVLILRETVGIHRWLAIGFGVVGMLVMIRPGGHGQIASAGVMLGLLSATLLASSTITLRQLGSTESATSMLFWFTAIGSVTGACLMPFFFQPHGPKVWLLIFAIMIVGTAGQMLATYSARFAPISVTAPFDYTQLIWASLLGWLIFSALPSFTTLIGAVFIGSAGLYTFYREHLRKRPGIAESTIINPAEID